MRQYVKVRGKDAYRERSEAEIQAVADRAVDPARLFRKIIKTALSLIEAADGDVECARGASAEAFEDASRFAHDQTILGEPDELDKAVMEQVRRLDQAAEARKTFRIIEPH